MTPTPRFHSIAFLCTGNSCRSQMAEGLARARLPDTVAVYSAGSHPSGVVNPLAVASMAELGIDIADQTSKGIAALPDTIDVVVTVCDHAAAHCPYLHGRLTTVHWPIPDPFHTAGSEADRQSAFREVRNLLDRHLMVLLNEWAGDQR